MKSFYVYVHTCPNGKKYVGLTTTDPKERWAYGWGYKNNSHFTRAILKYKWNNIDHQVFEVGTKEEMFYLEKYLIAYYQTNNPDFGYNKSSGGEAHTLGCHYVFTEDHKKKLSESHKGKHNSIRTEFKKGNHPSSEFKKGCTAWNKGIPCSEEKRRKISESLKRRNAIKKEL